MSRLVAPEEDDYFAIRPPGEKLELGRSAPPRPRAQRVSREEIIERERRFARPAASWASLRRRFWVAGVVARLQVPNESNAGAQLAAFSSHSQALVVSSVLEAAGTAAGRGAACVSVQSRRRLQPPRSPGADRPLRPRPDPLLGAGRRDQRCAEVGRRRLRGAGTSEPTQTLKSLQSAIDSKADSIAKVTVYNDANAAEVQATDGSFYSVTFPANAEQPLLDSLGKAGIDTSEDSGGVVGDAFANHLALDSSTYKAAGNLALPAGLTMIFAIVYPALQAFRVGLITRMVSTLGAIAAATLIILPLAPALIGLWLSWLGLTFLDRTPRERSPAWDAGVAVPWPRPGQEPSTEPTIDGSALEVDPDAPQPANPPRQRGERRKRKHRDA